MAEEVNPVVYMVDCETCGSLQPIETVQTEWIDGKPVKWEHRCATCGAPFGFIMDGGTLDLGIVKENIMIESNDFEVFTEEPWRT